MDRGAVPFRLSSNWLEISDLRNALATSAAEYGSEPPAMAQQQTLFGGEDTAAPRPQIAGAEEKS